MRPSRLSKTVTHEKTRNSPQSKYTRLASHIPLAVALPVPSRAAVKNSCAHNTIPPIVTGALTQAFGTDTIHRKLYIGLGLVVQRDFVTLIFCLPL